MKTVKQILSGVLTLAAFAGAVAVNTGCEKSGFGNGAGKAVSFTASSQGSSATKTFYGDDNVASGSKQAIPWKDTDVIRIASPTATVTSQADKYYSDYKVVPTAEGSSNATVQSYDVNGLAWGEDETYSFYSIYPAPVGDNASLPIELSNTDGKVKATIPGTQTATKSDKTKTAKETVGDKELTYTYSVYDPDMNYAYMTAAALDRENNADRSVPLTFYPAFTAFEINMTSGDDDFTVTDLSLSGTSIAGEFTTTAGTDFDTEKTTALASVTSGKGVDEISVSFGDGQAITTADGLSVTLFGVPVKNSGAITLNVTTADDEVAHLVLKYYKDIFDGEEKIHSKDDPYVFAPGKKYRINLLKLGGRYTYSIALAESALPWFDFEQSTSFSENVQSGPFKISGAVETENAYEAYDTGENNAFVSYEVFNAYSAAQKQSYTAAHPTYAYRYYQKRTLNMVTGAYFEFTFKPNAPLAGYWNLVPESAPSYGVTGQGGTEGFKIYLVKTDSDGEIEDPNAWSSGQIMGADVKIRIYPDPNRDMSKQYVMLFKTFFSANKSGDPAFSADSETQDAHGDGTFSYWKFIIPATE